MNKKIITFPLWLYLIIGISLVFALSFLVYFVYGSTFIALAAGTVFYVIFILLGFVHVKQGIEGTGGLDYIPLAQSSSRSGRKISKNELCNNCRKIRPKLNSPSGPKSGVPMEEFLDSKGYNMPNGYEIMNPTMLTHLEDNGGCPKCINLVRRATA